MDLQRVREICNATWLCMLKDLCIMDPCDKNCDACDLCYQMGTSKENLEAFMILFNWLDEKLEEKSHEN